MTEVRRLLDEVCDLVIEHLPQIEATRYEITIKEDGTPVTSSDLYIEQLVNKFVKTKLSNVIFIGEESFDFSSVITEDYVVVLDPIDGTENFCSGLKEWGVSFGLWKGTSFLGSFLLMPELGIRLVSGDQIELVKSRITGMSSSISKGIIDIMNQPGEYRMMGCAVYNLYNVIRGSFSRFVNPRGAYVWDLMPGMMLALEHGCKVWVEGELFESQFLDPTRKYRIDIIR